MYMKRFNEFEVIIPEAVFEHVSENSIIVLLSNFNVKFERKGSTDCEIEYLVTAPSCDVANSVRELLASLQRVVLAFPLSPMDKMRCKGWLFGIIREVECD